MSFSSLGFRLGQRLASSRHGRRIGAICAGLLLVVSSCGLTLSAVRLARLVASPVLTQGIVVRIDYVPDNDRYADNFVLTLADGRRLPWTCAETSCGHAVDTLFALQNQTPVPAYIEVAAGRIVGLSVRDVEVVSPELHAGRQMRDELRTFGLWAVALLVSGLWVLLAVRAEPGLSKKDRELVEAKVRRALSGDTR